MICNLADRTIIEDTYIYEEDNHDSDGRAPHNGSTGSETD